MSTPPNNPTPILPPLRLLKVWREEGEEARARAREEVERQDIAAAGWRARAQSEAQQLQQRVEEGGVVKATQAGVVQVDIRAGGSCCGGDSGRGGGSGGGGGGSRGSGGDSGGGRGGCRGGGSRRSIGSQIDAVEVLVLVVINLWKYE